jgi:hypothetical protein
MEDPTQVVEVAPTEATPENQHTGLQTRINELTAARKAAEQANQELMQRVMEQSARLMELQRPAPAPAAPDALAQHAAELDPRLVQVLEAERARMQAMFAAKMAQVEATQGQLQIQAAAAQMRNVPPEVAQRAQQLYQQAKLNGSAATPDEAIRYALGDWYLQQQQRAAGVAGVSPQAFNAPFPVLPAAPVIPAAATQQQYIEPPDFESWPLSKQLQYMEQKGIGNSSL